MAPPDDLLFETLSAFSPDAFTAPPLDALRLATFAAPLIESAAPLEALILAEVAFTSLNDIAAPLDASASTVFAVSPFILAAAPLEASKSNEPAVSDAMEIAPPLDMSISVSPGDDTVTVMLTPRMLLVKLLLLRMHSSSPSLAVTVMYFSILAGAVSVTLVFLA